MRQFSSASDENFITDILDDWQFIEDYGKRCKTRDVWVCLLVQQHGRKDGVRVLPEQACFISWAADLPEPEVD